MLYNSYLRRIEMLAKIRDILYKLRYFFLVLFLCVFVFLTIYVIIKGNFISELVLDSTEIEYGTAVSYRSNAILSDVQYQFREVGTEEWSEAEPIMPGDYEIRGVSKASFGAKKYSSTVKYRILPLSIEVFVSGDSISYGDIPNIDLSHDLPYGDMISGYEFEFFDRTENSARIGIIEGTLKISDSQGEDVIYAYKLSYTEKELRFTPREIIICSESSEKFYDGSPLVNSAWSVSESNVFAYGDTLDTSSLEVTGVITFAGQIENTIDISKIKINDQYGNNVTKFYDIKTAPGELNILKRPIKIQTGSAFMWYNDGYDILSCDEFELIEGSLVDGHKFVINGEITTISEIGRAENKIALSVVDEHGFDVTENYDISYIYGTLEIQKKTELFIKPLDICHIYNGFSQTYRNNELWSFVNPNDLKEGHTYNIVVEIIGERTVVGVSETSLNIISAEFYDEKGNVTDCYELVCKTGSIEILRADIQICSENIYINADNYNITVDTEYMYLGEFSVVPEGYYFECKNPYTINIERVSETLYKATVTDSFGVYFGEFESFEAVFENMINDITVFDQYGNDVTENFNVITENGMIILMH